MEQLTRFERVGWSCSRLTLVFWRSIIRRKSSLQERSLQENEPDLILFTKLFPKCQAQTRQREMMPYETIEQNRGRGGIN